MRNKFLVSMEELEINKVLEEDEAELSQYDELYHEVKGKIEMDREKEESMDEDDDGGDADTDLDSASEDDVLDEQDLPEKEDPDDKDSGESKEDSEEAKKGTEDKDSEDSSEENKDEGSTSKDEPGTEFTPKEPIAVEGARLARELRHYDSSVHVANENAIMTGLRHAVKISVDAVAALASLGIEYTPRVAKALAKGLIYTVSGIAKVVYAGHEKLTNYMAERERSLSKLESDLDSLSSTLAEVKKSLEDSDEDITEKLSELDYSDKEVINALKSADNTDFLSNLTSLSNFLSSSIKEISVVTDHEFRELTSLVSPTEPGVTASAQSLVPEGLRKFLKGSKVKGFDPNSELLDSISYASKLPGDVSLIAYVPKKDIDSMEQLASAYKGTKLFLGLDTSKLAQVAKVDYMGVADLEKMIAKLQSLVNVCKQHQKLYKDIDTSSKSIARGLKRYIDNLAKSDKGVTLDDTNATAIELKVELVNKVYLTGAMDIHNYVTNTVSKATKYVSANIKQMS